MAFVWRKTSEHVCSLMTSHKMRPCHARLHGVLKQFYRTKSTTLAETRVAQIKQHSILSRDHMTPEVALHLITRDCPLWSGKADDNTPFIDPFWAFYWPGGQVMTRFIIDNPVLFKDQTILDVGSGCGASSIACSMVGAKRVIANDVDPYAATAAELNAEANSVTVETSVQNLIGRLQPDWSVVLLGDMFYDEAFRDILVEWVKQLYNKFKTRVFIGDPGRLPLINHPIRNDLTKVASYELPDVCKEENNGLSTGFVWMLDAG